MILEQARKKLDDLRARRSHAITSIKLHEQRQLDIEQEMALNDQALDVIKMCVEAKLDVRKSIEQMVNMVLDAAFPGDGLIFLIVDVVDQETGVLTGLKFEIEENGIRRPVIDLGGGVTNVVSETVRKICIAISPVLENLYISDEPTPNMDLERWDLLSQVGDRLSEIFGMQEFIITHSGTLFPTTYMVEKVKGVSRVTVVCQE